MRIIKIDMNKLSEYRFRARLERLQMGLPIMIKDQRSRTPSKRRRLIEFYLRTTPCAEDILSGKAIRKLLND